MRKALICEVDRCPFNELRSKLSHIPNLDNFDMDENDVQSISSKYFDISDFSKSNFSFSKQFSLLHVNTGSLSKNFDQLSAVLSALGIPFDVLSITETKRQIGKEFISNVSIDNYLMYTQPSKSSAGGVAISINNKFDHVKRDDLSILHDDFESVWVKIKNKKGKNFLCGCMYRHSNTNVENFLGHIEYTLSRFDKNRYHVFLMGDFNIDLLQYESHKSYQ